MGSGLFYQIISIHGFRIGELSFTFWEMEAQDITDAGSRI